MYGKHEKQKSQEKAKINKITCIIHKTPPNFENFLQAFPSFDGKKEYFILFYLRQFEGLATQTKLTMLKLIVLKAKFAESARDQVRRGIMKVLKQKS